MRCVSLTILSCAILVGVVATEDDTRLVAIDEPVVPASGLCGGGLAEVLGVVGGAVAKSLDVVTSVGGKNLSLGQSLTEPCPLGGIARLVDLIFAHGALRPIIDRRSLGS